MTQYSFDSSFCDCLYCTHEEGPFQTPHGYTVHFCEECGYEFIDICYGCEAYEMRTNLKPEVN